LIVGSPRDSLRPSGPFRALALLVEKSHGAFPICREARKETVRTDIDGRRLLTYVEEQVEISPRHRNEGHPKFWGRIIGTSADAESAEWLEETFASIGLSDVHTH
jgi:hypothetical protein